MQYYQEKTYQINQLPIQNELAAVIQEAIRESKKMYGEEVKYVFAKSITEPIANESFSYHLNKLVYKKGIKDKDGNLVRIKPSHFRGTVATKYANIGLSLNVIRMLLGQNSFGSIKHYAEIHDSTVKEAMKEIIEHQDEMIKNIGNISKVKPKTDEDNHFIPLPNGQCKKPISQGKCSHANACYTCSMFKHDPQYLKLYEYHLHEARKNISIAKMNGFERILQVNKNLEESLLKIIDRIEPQVGEKNE